MRDATRLVAVALAVAVVLSGVAVLAPAVPVDAAADDAPSETVAGLRERAQTQARSADALGEQLREQDRLRVNLSARFDDEDRLLVRLQRQTNEQRRAVDAYEDAPEAERAELREQMRIRVTEANATAAELRETVRARDRLHDQLRTQLTAQNRTLADYCGADVTANATNATACVPVRELQRDQLRDRENLAAEIGDGLRDGDRLLVRVEDRLVDQDRLVARLATDDGAVDDLRDLLRAQDRDLTRLRAHALDGADAADRLRDRTRDHLAVTDRLGQHARGLDADYGRLQRQLGPGGDGNGNNGVGSGNDGAGDGSGGDGGSRSAIDTSTSAGLTVLALGGVATLAALRRR